MSTIKYKNPKTGAWEKLGISNTIEAKGMTMDLLWTNPNPSAAFEAQTVELDLSQYDFVGIAFCVNGGTNYRTDNLFFYLKGAVKSAHLMKSGTVSDYQYSRAVSINNNGVDFETGLEAHLASSGYSRTQTDAYAIPLQIYGIKNTPVTYPEGGGTVESIEHPGCFYRTVGGVVEWLNPPMELGVEYKTTERYMGKPVYVKTFDCGALPDGNKNTVTDIENYDSIVGISGYAFDSSNGSRLALSYVGTITDYVFISWANGRIVTHTAGSWSNWPNHNVTIKYTKTTD